MEWPEGHQESHNVVGSLRPAERPKIFEPATFSSWLQRLNQLSHSPQFYLHITLALPEEKYVSAFIANFEHIYGSREISLPLKKYLQMNWRTRHSNASWWIISFPTSFHKYFLNWCTTSHGDLSHTSWVIKNLHRTTI